MPTSRTGNSRMAILRFVPRRPGITACWLTKRILEASVRFEERPVGEKPFSPEGAGMAAKVKGRQLRNWRLAHGWAAEFAPGLQESAEPLQELTLIPYGCTNIRVTEFPRLRK